MTTKDYLKTYILRRLHEMEERKRSKGIAPTHVMGIEAHDTFMDDVVASLDELRDSGLVEQGECLNDIYLRLTPEGAVE